MSGVTGKRYAQKKACGGVAFDRELRLVNQLRKYENPVESEDRIKEVFKKHEN